MWSAPRSLLNVSSLRISTETSGQVILTSRISPCHWWTWGWIPCRLWSSGIVCRRSGAAFRLVTATVSLNHTQMSHESWWVHFVPYELTKHRQQTWENKIVFNLEHLCHAWSTLLIYFPMLHHHFQSFSLLAKFWAYQFSGKAFYSEYQHISTQWVIHQLHMWGLFWWPPLGIHSVWVLSDGWEISWEVGYTHFTTGMYPLNPSNNLT